MNVIDSHQTKTDVLKSNLDDVALEEKPNFYQSSDKSHNPLRVWEDLPAHALDENDGVPLSSKEDKLIWLAIIVGQLVLGLIVYAIF